MPGLCHDRILLREDVLHLHITQTALSAKQHHRKCTAVRSSHRKRGARCDTATTKHTGIPCSWHPSRSPAQAAEEALNSRKHLSWTVLVAAVPTDLRRRGPG